MANKKAPKKISLEADQELEQHLREPFYVIQYDDGTEARFNIGDIVALNTTQEYFEDVDNKNADKAEIVYNVELISGLSFSVDKSAYDELLKLKHWDDTKDNTRFVRKDIDK